MIIEIDLLYGWAVLERRLNHVNKWVVADIWLLTVSWTLTWEMIRIRNFIASCTDNIYDLENERWLLGDMIDHVGIYGSKVAEGSNQFGLFTEQKFCHKSSRSILIDNRFCNRFINLGRPIFSLNHSGASAATVFTIPTTFGNAHAPCYTRAEWATQSAARVGSSLFDFLTDPSTHYVPKIVFTFSPICRACKNSIAIYLIIMRDFFSLHRPAPAIRHWVFWLVVIVTAGSGTSLVIAQWLEHSTCTKNMSHKKYHNNLFPNLDVI